MSEKRNRDSSGYWTASYNVKKERGMERHERGLIVNEEDEFDLKKIQ